MTQLYWHCFSIELSEGGYLTIIAGESSLAQVVLPFMAAVPFSDDPTEVEWAYLGSWNHSPNEQEKYLAEVAAGYEVEPLSGLERELDLLVEEQREEFFRILDEDQ